MTHAERYLLLGLQLGRHVDGLVDAYYGPSELKVRADDGEPLPPEQLAADADALLADVGDSWLGDQVAGLATYARVVGGERIAYSDEVERCYGVRPQRTPEAFYEGVHAQLDELLPGDGPVGERYIAWRKTQLVGGDVAVTVVRELLPFLRERTLGIVELPDGETLELEPVHDEPWWAFNYYLGDLRSRVVLNADVPTSAYDLIHLAAHEVYPGHHTEHAVKEARFVKSGTAIEEAIQLVPTPQAVLSEGIAETGEDVVLDAAAREETYAIIRRHVPDADLERAHAVALAREGLRNVGVNAALAIHEDGASHEEAREYIERWALQAPEQAEHSVSFLTDPTWRAYSITYSAGRDLCRCYVGGDPSRFRRLLTEHVRIAELLSG
jgi:hypothetical protein